MTPRVRGLVVHALALAALFSGCQREERRFGESAPMTARPVAVRILELLPYPNAEAPYARNAWAVAEGKRLYEWYNCAGCHARGGGGGSGPPLLNLAQHVNREPEDIFTTIVEGRRNGMPPYAGKISVTEIWQIIAYVRALGGLAPADVMASRDDHMDVMQ
jgi:cytochrome c oxidase cbb3-type subunit 3